MVDLANTHSRWHWLSSYHFTRPNGNRDSLH